jgi:hypothetical protein
MSGEDEGGIAIGSRLIMANLITQLDQAGPHHRSILIRGAMAGAFCLSEIARAGTKPATHGDGADAGSRERRLGPPDDRREADTPAAGTTLEGIRLIVSDPRANWKPTGGTGNISRSGSGIRSGHSMSGRWSAAGHGSGRQPMLDRSANGRSVGPRSGPLQLSRCAAGGRRP